MIGTELIGRSANELGEKEALKRYCLPRVLLGSSLDSLLDFRLPSKRCAAA